MNHATYQEDLSGAAPQPGAEDQPEGVKKRSLWSWIKVGISTSWKTLREFLHRLKPGKHAWQGAALGVGLLGYAVIVVMSVDVFLPAGWPFFALMVVLFPLVYAGLVFLSVKLLQLIAQLPWLFLWGTLAGALMTMTGFGFFDRSGFLAAGLVLVNGSLLGASLWSLIRVGWKGRLPLRKVFLVLGLVLGLGGTLLSTAWLLDRGFHVPLPERALEAPNLPSLAQELPDPALAGPYPVASLTYGSGTDRRRVDFGDNTDLVTGTVDGSDLVSNWTGLRTMVWGFDTESLPINGRVWYPEGEGLFPLVLVVHGNHLAEDYSDPGYRYLCELLASQGMICVSVDENFLNGSGVADILGFNGLEGENDLRGWLLLKHLEVWSAWSETPDHPFYHQVDMDRIALIGHSRGGEAVAIAAAFNRLDHYPDNANIRFDFDFGIQSLVAIAPVDRQYQPAGEPIPLEDVNYLVLQGSHDMDVRSFDGYNAFDRVSFSGDGFFFKSALYIWGANHGQFNTVWGDNDLGTPPIWLYNREQLLSGEAQTQIAGVLTSAFLQATLGERPDYLPLFQNIQTGLAWLPESIYINAYGDSRTHYWADYEEDVDVTSAGDGDLKIFASGLAVWYEDRVSTKWGKMHSNSAVHLGWEDAGEGKKYTLRFSGGAPDLSAGDQLVFSAAQTGRTLNDAESPQPADFSIVLVDTSGRKAVLPLSSVAPLQPAIDVDLYKWGFLNDGATSEVVFQTYLFEFGDFLAENPDFDLAGLCEIRFIFDRSDGAEILLDGIGIRTGAGGSGE
jgi:dienelactone hydrolase